MPAYDQTPDPPAPVAVVTVFHPTTGEHTEGLPGKLDCGADVTVIPDRVVSELTMAPKGHLWTRSFDGTYSRRPVYYVRMAIEGFDVRIVRSVAADRDNVLVGRNVLNRFLLVLDGKNLAFELRDP